MKWPEEERLAQEHVLDWASGRTFSGVVSDVSATGHSGECAASAGPQAMARTYTYRRIFTCNICLYPRLPAGLQLHQPASVPLIPGTWDSASSTDVWPLHSHSWIHRSSGVAQGYLHLYVTLHSSQYCLDELNFPMYAVYPSTPAPSGLVSVRTQRHLAITGFSKETSRECTFILSLNFRRSNPWLGNSVLQYPPRGASRS